MQSSKRKLLSLLFGYSSLISIAMFSEHIFSTYHGLVFSCFFLITLNFGFATIIYKLKNFDKIHIIFFHKNHLVLKKYHFIHSF